MSDTVQITITENGPYKVEGPIELTDHEGNAVEAPGSTVFLCRCGGSQNKPFCDGTHSKIGFEGARRAVAEAEGETSA
jgi:CDGSH-type Zn-finger protein